MEGSALEEVVLSVGDVEVGVAVLLSALSAVGAASVLAHLVLDVAVWAAEADVLVAAQLAAAEEVAGRHRTLAAAAAAAVAAALPDRCRAADQAQE